MDGEVRMTGLTLSRIDAILGDPEYSTGLSAAEKDMLLDTRLQLSGGEQ